MLLPHTTARQTAPDKSNKKSYVLQMSWHENQNRWESKVWLWHHAKDYLLYGYLRTCDSKYC